MSKEYGFTKLSDAPLVEEVSENATMLVADEGKIVRTAMSNAGGGGGIEFLYVIFDGEGNVLSASENLYDKIAHLLDNLLPIHFTFYKQYDKEYMSIFNPKSISMSGNSEDTYHYEFYADGGYYCHVYRNEIRWNEVD